MTGTGNDARATVRHTLLDHSGMTKKNYGFVLTIQNKDRLTTLVSAMNRSTFNA